VPAFVASVALEFLAMSLYARRRSSATTPSRGKACMDIPPPGSPSFGGLAAADQASSSMPDSMQDASASQECRTSSLRVSELPRPSDQTLGPSAHSTPFDERVKSVRSKIREMMANAGEESDSDKSTGDSAGSCRASGPSNWTGAHRASSSTSNAQVVCAARVDPSDTGVSGRSVLVTHDISASGVGSSHREKAGPTAPWEEASAAIDLTLPTKPGSGNTGGMVYTAPCVIGRDIAPHVGARVCIVDSRIARFVEPAGRIVEVRCKGERVQVLHDGPDQAKRYYNTGKAGEYQLVLEGNDSGHALNSATSPPATSKLPANPQPPKSLPCPPASEDARRAHAFDESEMAPPTRRKSYSDLRKERGDLLVDGKPAGSTGFVSIENPSYVEGEKPQRTMRYSEMRRASAPSRSTQHVNDSAACVIPSVAESRTAMVSETAEPATASTETLYSERRASKHIARRESSQLSEHVEFSRPCKDFGTTRKEDEKPTLQPSKRYSDKRRSSTQRVSSVGEEQAASAFTASSSSVPGAASKDASFSSLKMTRADEVEIPIADAQDCRSETKLVADPRLDHLEREYSALASRLRSVQDAFTGDLQSMRDAVGKQMQASEQRLLTMVAQVLQEAEKRARSGSGTPVATRSGQVPVGKLFGGSDADDADKQSGFGHFEPEPAAPRTPVIEEPEQEHEVSVDTTHYFGGGNHKRLGKPELVQHYPSPSPSRMADDVSSAELADSKQRLEAIGSAARRVSAILEGDIMRNEASLIAGASKLHAEVWDPGVPSDAVDPRHVESKENGRVMQDFHDGRGPRWPQAVGQPINALPPPPFFHGASTAESFREDGFAAHSRVDQRRASASQRQFPWSAGEIRESSLGRSSSAQHHPCHYSIGTPPHPGPRTRERATSVAHNTPRAPWDDEEDDVF